MIRHPSVTHKQCALAEMSQTRRHSYEVQSQSAEDCFGNADAATRAILFSRVMSAPCPLRKVVAQFCLEWLSRAEANIITRNTLAAVFEV